MERLIDVFNTNIDINNKISESNLLEFKASETVKAGRIQGASTVLGALPDFLKLKFTPKIKTSAPSKSVSGISVFA